ncbi:MAG: hypothetical protein ABII09_07060 [Planctomycetota bacterium]
MSEIESQIKDELCPDGVWCLSDRMKNVLIRQITRLPNGEVPKEEAMYPNTASGMRTFLEVFFSRHYFQVQNSLLDYIISADFYRILDDAEIRILDIGCGPAVGALAVTDIIMCLLENQNIPVKRSARFVYVLNDTSRICLAVGQRMLAEYFDLCRAHRISVGEHTTLTLTSNFPDNIKQLERIRKNFGAYHLAMFSYVVRPLVEDNGIGSLARDIVETEKLCDPRGRALILQDQYRESLMRTLGKQIDVSVENKELTQKIFPNRGTADTYTYSYYQCLYKPRPGERNTYYRSAEAVAG